MDRHAAEEYVRRWAFQPVPMRPSPMGLEHYREVLRRRPAPATLIYGGTPELADLAVAEGASRVLRMDMSRTILDGMRALSTRDWSSVETVAGDWLADRPELAGRFDVAMCDGGPLFLEFPAQWRRFFARVHGCLRQGGAFVFKSQAHPPGFPSFEVVRDAKIAAFKAQAGAMGEEERIRAFWRLAGNLWQACFLGSTSPEGRIDKAAVARRMDLAADHLAASFADPVLRDIAHQELRVMLRNADATPVLECLVPHHLATPLLAEAGFAVEGTVFLADSEPVADYCYQVTAIKR